MKNNRKLRGEIGNTFHLSCCYAPSEKARNVLSQGRIIDQEETPQDFLERVVATIFSVEDAFGTPPERIHLMAEEFAEYMATGCITLGSPTLTNAGRYSYALSSCAMLPINLSVLNEATKESMRSHYKQNMGGGFEFNCYDDPVAKLVWVNEFAAQESATGNYERYIGNMGLLHVSHPSVRAFIEAKRHREMRHFNISIDVTEEFMRRVENEDLIALADGTQIKASEILHLMAENAWQNGEPGLIFLERMNKDNPMANSSMYSYVTTAPCAEIGLAKGEACHFGYINLYSFVQDSSQGARINYDRLRDATQLLTRALDNAIEYSMLRYPMATTTYMAQMNRKMAIGVCGLADLFLAHKLPYDSSQARMFARDVLSFINYISKCTSVTLAEARGSCLAMNFPQVNKYVNGTLLEAKYARNPTRTVSSHDWEKLANTIRRTGKLRNMLTTALAPTGRSSILLDATSSIEPLFSIFTSDGSLQKQVLNFLSNELAGDEHTLAQVCQQASLAGSFQHIESLPPSVRECLKTAKEIAPLAHLQMVATVAGMEGVIDEAASKTVNLPMSATVDDVKDIFLAAYHLGLKNISVYRDKTMVGQPMHL